METVMTKAEVMKALEGVPKVRHKSVVCALVGHSRMLGRPCFGYQYCGRCREQIGDTLGSSFSMKDKVVKEHGCDECKANAALLTWQDRLLMPAPAKWLAKKPTPSSGAGEVSP